MIANVDITLIISLSLVHYYVYTNCFNFMILHVYLKVVVLHVRCSEIELAIN